MDNIGQLGVIRVVLRIRIVILITGSMTVAFPLAVFCVVQSTLP